MNILINCYVYPPEVQSAGVMSQQLAEDLVKSGHHVTVITGFPQFPRGELYEGWKRCWRQHEEKDGYRVIRVWHTLGMRRSLLGRLVYYLTFSISACLAGLWVGEIDAIFDISPPLIGNAIALALAHLKGARFFYVNWDIYPEIALDTGILRPGLIARCVGWFDRFLGNRATRVLVLADALKGVLVRRGVDPERIAVLPIWTSIQDTPVPAAARSEWRASQGIDSDTFVILYAGTIGMLNDAEVLVEAVEKLSDRQELLLLFVGDGARLDRVRRRAGRGSANVRFTPLQPQAMMPAIYAAADLCAVTLAKGKGHTCAPSKLLGYMAAERPVIAIVDTDSATADWVRAAECGVIVPPGDATAVAHAITELMDSPTRRLRLGKNGPMYVRQMFSRSHCTPLYESVLCGAQT